MFEEEGVKYFKVGYQSLGDRVSDFNLPDN